MSRRRERGRAHSGSSCSACDEIRSCASPTFSVVACCALEAASVVSLSICLDALSGSGRTFDETNQRASRLGETEFELRIQARGIASRETRRARIPLSFHINTSSNAQGPRNEIMFGDEALKLIQEARASDATGLLRAYK